MDGRRNRRNVNAGMSRRQFLKTTGIAVAGAGAAAAGLAGAANANLSNRPFPESVAGGGNNYNVWPVGNDNLTHVHPKTNEPCTQDAFNVQYAVDNVDEGGVVRLHSKNMKTEATYFQFGQSNVTVHKSVTIIGQSDHGKTKALVKGSSSKSLNATGGPNQNYAPELVGIFNIYAPGKEVEFNNLAIDHTFTHVISENFSTFGSITLPNRGSALLKVLNCDIDTIASSAVATPASPAKSKIVRNCKIRGKADMVDGNYSCINVGSFGDSPPNLLDARIEVTDCHLDSALFVGVIILDGYSNANTVIDVKRNRIGHTPRQPNPVNGIVEATSVGVIVGAPFLGNPQNPIFAPINGKITIVENMIKLSRYYSGGPLAGGISTTPEKDGNVLIENNIIDFSLPFKLPEPAPGLSVIIGLDAITYEDFTEEATALIQNNTILTSKPPYAPSLVPVHYGVALGNESALGGFVKSSAKNVTVQNNDYSGLAVVPYLRLSSLGPQFTPGFAMFMNDLTNGNTAIEPGLTCADINDLGSNSVTAGGVNC